MRWIGIEAEFGWWMAVVLFSKDLYSFEDGVCLMRCFWFFEDGVDSFLTIYGEGFEENEERENEGTIAKNIREHIRFGSWQGEKCIFSNWRE